ncbi:MAG: 50S ribosomal protein L32 [bacterium]
MPVPAHRRSRTRKRLKRAHTALKKTKLAACPKCQKPVLPHRACSFCGIYNGRPTLKIKAKKNKKSEEKNK